VPIEPTAQSQLGDFLRLLRRRRWQIVLPAAFVLTLGSAFAVVVPKKYVVETRIEIRETRVEGDYQRRNPGQTSPVKEVQNAEEHVKHYARIVDLVEKQGRLWPDFVDGDPVVRRKIVNGIRRDLTVDVVEKQRNEGSTFVDISYRDVDVERAEVFLTALTERWVKDVHGRDLEEVENEREVLQEERKEAGDAFNEADNRWVTLARRMDVDPLVDPNQSGKSPGGRDPVFELLNQSRNKLEQAEADLAGKRLEIDNLKARIEQEPELVPKQTGLETDTYAKEIAPIEAKILVLRTRQSKLTPVHSLWQQIEDEIALLMDETERLKNELVPNPVREKLVAALEKAEDEKAKLEVEVSYRAERAAFHKREGEKRIEDWAVLLRLWEGRQRAETELTRVSTELANKETDLRVMQEAWVKPYEIVQPALAADAPTEPNGWVIVVFSLFLGLALGLAVALVAEYGRDTYRSLHDLAGVMDVPVLGAIAPIRTRAQVRRARNRRAVVGTASAIILGGVSWVTWVWYAAPDKLPVEVLRAIESFQGLWM